MSLITLKFFIFLCVIFISYYSVPKLFGEKVKALRAENIQWIILLAGSIIFYLYASPKYLIFLLISSISTYVLARAIQGTYDKALDNKSSDTSDSAAKNEALKSVEKKCKLYVFIAVLINMGILAVLKYTGFFFEIINSIAKTDLPMVRFILPLGISFYTFTVIGYIVDVYRRDVKAEENYFKYLLFVSFFPQITEGPINRFKRTGLSLQATHEFDFDRCKKAGYRILLGLFKKVVIAGRFGVYVDRVYDNVHGYGGLTLLLATVFYAIQIYADFSGCMDMVMGIAALFGIDMDENFDKPFFSKSVSEFWRRWHVTLGAWFRDYIYNPVFKSEFCRKIKNSLKNTPLKKKSTNVIAAIALTCVWIFTGVWHGAAMHYVIYGVYYGVIVIFSMLMSGVYKKIHKTLKINFESKAYHVFETVRTLCIVTGGFLIFRANNMGEVLFVLKTVFTNFRINGAALAEAILPFTEDNTAVAYGFVAGLAAFIMFLAEFLEFNNIDFLKKRKYLCGAFLIVFTLLFGVFGESGFLYAAY